MMQGLPQGSTTSRQHQVEAPVVAGEGAAIKQLEAFVAEVISKGLAEFASVYIIQRDQHGIPGFGIAILEGPGSEHFPPSLSQLHKAQPAGPPAVSHVSMDGSRAFTPARPTMRTVSLDCHRRTAFNMYNARSKRLFRLDDSGWTVTDAKVQGKPRLYSCRRHSPLTGLQTMEAAWLHAAGMRSMLSVPCLHAGRVCGSVLLASKGTDWEEKATYHAVHKVAPAVHAAGIQLAAGLPVHRFVPADEIACGVLHELVHLDKILLCRIMAPGVSRQHSQPKQADVRQHGANQMQQNQMPGGSTGGTVGAKLHKPYAGGVVSEQTLNTIRAYYRQTPAKAPDAATTTASPHSDVQPTHDIERLHTPANQFVGAPAGSISLSGLVQDMAAPSPFKEQNAITQSISQTAPSEPQLGPPSNSRPSRLQQSAAVVVARIPTGQQLTCVSSDSPDAIQHDETGSAEPTKPQCSPVHCSAVPAALRPCHWVPDQSLDARQDVSTATLQSARHNSNEDQTHKGALPGSGAALSVVGDKHSWQFDALFDTAQQPQGHATQPLRTHLQSAADICVEDTADVSSATHMMLSRLQGACHYMVARSSLGEVEGITHQRNARSEDLLQLSKRVAMTAACTEVGAPHVSASACMADAVSQPMMRVNMLDPPSHSSATGTGPGLWSSAHGSQTALFDPYGSTKDLHMSSVGLRHQHNLSSTNINQLMLHSLDNSLDLGTPDGKSSPIPAASTALRQWRSHGAASGRKPRSLPTCGPMTPLSALSPGHTDRAQEGRSYSPAGVLPVTGVTVHSEYMGDGNSRVQGTFLMDESMPQERERGCMQSMPSWEPSPHLDPGTMEYMSGSLQYAMECLGPTLTPRAFVQAKASMASDHECVQLASSSMLFSPSSHPGAPSRTSSKPC